ncbi:MAG: glutamate mutase L [Chloroflexota bacterium]
MSRSILAADFGSVFTRVLLMDVVGGGYRIVAKAEVPSTGGFPAGDVTLGLRRAAARISRVTGRTLLDNNGRIISPENENRTGVDIFLATASGGRPLKAVLLGLMPDVSIESGRRATEGTYVNIEETISLGEDRDEEDQLNAIILTNPDIVLITGGTEGGATAPLEGMLTLAKTAIAAMPADGRPDLLYAGNSLMAERVEAELSPLTRVFVAENVRPSLDHENLNDAQLQLGRAFDRYKEAQGSGFDVVGSMSQLGLFPTAQSYATVARYLGSSRDQDAIVVDVGSATGTFASYMDGEVKTSIRTDIGMGTSAPDIVETLDIDAIRRWIPYSVARADVMNYAMNKRVRPITIPMTRKQLYIEYALLRAAVTDMLEKQRPQWANGKADVDLIMASGSPFTATGSPGITAMLLLDAIQPTGKTELYSDTNSVISSLGALAYLAPEAVVQLMAGDSIERLATVFSVDGVPNVNRAAVSYKIEYDDGLIDEGGIDGGEFIVLDLPPGKTAKLRLQARGSLRIGDRRRINMEVKGSLAGVIIDTRGRPIPLGLDLNRRMLQMMLWYSRASNFFHEEIPEEDLEPVEERDVIEPLIDDLVLEAEPEEKAQRRRGRRGRQQEEEVAAPATVQELLDDTDIDIDELEAIFEDDEEDPFDELLR